MSKDIQTYHDDVDEDAPWLDCADGFKDLPDEDADLIKSETAQWAAPLLLLGGLLALLNRENLARQGGSTAVGEVVLR